MARYYGDEEGRARTEVKPALLAEAAGVSYQEFSNLSDPLPVISADEGLVLQAGSQATQWIDCLVPGGAEVLATYEMTRRGYLAKPFTPEELLERLRMVLPAET